MEYLHEYPPTIHELITAPEGKAGGGEGWSRTVQDEVGVWNVLPITLQNLGAWGILVRAPEGNKGKLEWPGKPTSW